jgi:hypothetical protein
MAVPLIRLMSPSMNTRSHGTSTSSKNATQSISSKREPSGWSKRDRPRSKLSRHRKRRPGVPHGMAKLSAKGLCGWSSWARRGEYTAISSAIGPSVASTRAPRTTTPASVSRTTCSAVPSSRFRTPDTVRLRCRLMRACVSVRSFSRMYS